VTAPQISAEQQSKTAITPSVLDDEYDDDDAALIEAFMSSPLQDAHDMSAQPPVGVRASRNAVSSMRQTTLFGLNTTRRPMPSQQNARGHQHRPASRTEPPTHHKIDVEAMKTWTYPINLGRIRDYQYNIVHKSLFNNLLVALPTGLGKTFIAATVMLNWYRWTNDAQIIFMAPTKPLVYQQAEACYRIAGIPKNDTIILTGEANSAFRAETWKSKRVFFMTPQTVFNDLAHGRVDPKNIVLLVVDEAHKATGSYAYVQVVDQIRKFNSSFRVLALTATPGGTVEAVQKVIDGLDIARVEIRTEESIDIREFVHSRDTQVEIFDNSDELNTCLELFGGAVGPVLNQLAPQNAYWGRDPTAITLFGLRMAQQEWAKSDAGRKAGFGTKKWIHNMFQPLMSLAHNLELLKFHGIGPFYHKMKRFEDESYGMGKQAKQIVEDQHFKKLMNYMRTWVNDPEFVGHPKLEYLKQVVLNHFMDAENGGVSASGRSAADTRIMVFAHYRDSAEEIVRLLQRHRPMIKPHLFVGQSGTKGSAGMNQKMQIEILDQFKNGKYNTLVATSIGEEGLDIGEVDLIVCYDSSKSPIRMLQRMGRTGRKRAGKIAVLLMRGKEENDFLKAKDSYQKMQGIIESGREFTFHDERSPRIVPKEIVPLVDKRIVDIPVENTQGALPDHTNTDRKRTIPKKRPAKQFHMPEGVNTGFSFVGRGSKKSKVNAAPNEPVLDAYEAVLSPVDQVILKLSEKQELEQNYQQIAGTEPQYIEGIRFDAFPGFQQKFSKTARITHSRATKALVSALQSMRNTKRDWTRPTAEAVLSLDSPQYHNVVTQSSMPPPQHLTHINRRHRSPKTSVTLGSSDALTPGEYDDADSFIDDASGGNSSPGTSPDLSILREPSKAVAATEVPFWISQKSTQGTDMSDEDFPDLENMFGGSRGSKAPAQSFKVSKTDRSISNRQSLRRVVDSDDDD
jgi:ATP-dependent DNA helicase MPH1